MVQNLASPRLSGRVDSTALDLNSWVNPNYICSNIDLFMYLLDGIRFGT